MSRFIKKLIAVLIALWLPLFSSNMMAMPITMLGGSAHSSSAAEHSSADAIADATDEAAADHCSMHHEPAGGHSQSDSGCKHSAACQLVVAVGQIEIALLTLAEHQIPYAVFFQSQTVAPLDTPPLARA